MTRAPRTWIDPWPHGQPAPGTPAAAKWVAQLAEHLTRTGLDAATIADAAGLDVRTVTSILDGTRWPTVHTATALATLEHPSS